MSNFLTKEEIKQWRSSLEKMTLEEYAAKLGKSINNEKQTNDIIDKVMVTNSTEFMSVEEYKPKAEMIRSIAQATIVKERELADKYNIRIKKPIAQNVVEKKSAEIKKEIDNKVFIEPISDVKVEKDASGYNFNKKLTPREQTVFDYFLKNKGQIVYAKDLAQLLELPKDYIYKYIKTLRNKTVEDCIVNAENGGFILK